MRLSVGDDLAWNAVKQADKAYEQKRQAEQDLADYNRLAGLGLKGVSIDPASHTEAETRVTAARQEFRNILRITELLEVKDCDPNPTPEIIPLTEEKQAQLAECFRGTFGSILRHPANDDRAPAGIDARGFKTLAQGIQGDLEASFIDKAFKTITRGRDSDYVMSTDDGAVLRLDTLGVFTQELNHQDELGKRSFGPATLGLFNMVSEFVLNNTSVLLGEEPQE